jgi:hypothetical protein
MLRNKNNFILFLFLFFLVSCNIYLPIEPVDEVNDRFLADYGNLVEKSKKKHNKSIEDAKYDGSVTFEKTAYGRLKNREEKFLKENMANKPYYNLDTGGEENVKYLSQNNEKLRDDDTNIFNEIDVKRDDFKHYDLGKKEYTEVSNKELQSDYDLILEREKQERYKERIEKLKIEKEEKDNESFLSKINTGFKKFSDKIKSLIK